MPVLMTERVDRVIRIDAARVVGKAMEVLSRTPGTSGSVPASRHEGHVRNQVVGYTSTRRKVTALPFGTLSC